MGKYQADVGLDLRVDEGPLQQRKQVPRTHIEAKFLEGLGECCLVEEGEGGVGESGLEEVLIEDSVELVGPQNYRHYILLIKIIMRINQSEQMDGRLLAARQRLQHAPLASLPAD